MEKETQTYLKQGIGIALVSLALVGGPLWNARRFDRALVERCEQGTNTYVSLLQAGERDEALALRQKIFADINDYRKTDIRLADESRLNSVERFLNDQTIFNTEYHPRIDYDNEFIKLSRKK